MAGPERGTVSVPELQLLQRGDPATWDRAFDLLWPDAYHVARRRLARMTSADAEDVAVMAIQDAAARVDRVHSFDEFRALVRLLAHRRAIDVVRSQLAATRQPPSPVTPFPPQDSEPPDDAPEPWEQADAIDLARWLAGAMQALSPVEQGLLVGHYLEGRTHAELAEIHGLQRPTLGIRLARILVKLRRQLAAHPRLCHELLHRITPS
ncbi:MAG: sigma-70 family RNA polymerase sigma factor [Verrucomicrobiota bacterium]